MSNWWAQHLSQGNTPPRPNSHTLPEVRRQPPPPVVVPVQQKTVDFCPSCGSENYMSPSANISKRCYDCGYPVSQSGTGVSGTSTEGTVKKAVQVDTPGYSPGSIVGRIE